MRLLSPEQNYKLACTELRDCETCRAVIWVLSPSYVMDTYSRILFTRWRLSSFKWYSKVCSCFIHNTASLLQIPDRLLLLREIIDQRSRHSLSLTGTTEWESVFLLNLMMGANLTSEADNVQHKCLCRMTYDSHKSLGGYEIITVYSESHMEFISVLCGESVDF
jgi:hypothetical protein